ncbi:unnamed protein product [Gordionus sp. m RMFG-2023]
MPNSSNSLAANNSKIKNDTFLSFSKSRYSQRLSIDYLKVELAKDPDNMNKALVRKIMPGLSSFTNNATFSAEYLIKLIDSVIVKIPLPKLQDTPLYIMATAGMRLVSFKEQEAILKDCRHDIAIKYPQLVFPPSHIQIISGKMEGIYAWIAMNYMLGKFDRQANSTVGILEMGGGSLQIAYEVPGNYSNFFLNNSENTSQIEEYARKIIANSIYQLDLSGRISNKTIKKAWNYGVYVTSLLGFGTNEIIAMHKKSLILKHLQVINNTNISGDSIQILDPCYPIGYKYKLLVHNWAQNDSTYKINVTGTGNFKLCHKSLLPMLKLDSECSLEPCSLSGLHDPIGFYAKLPNYTLLPKFYGISEFWYSSHDILGLGGLYNSTAFENKSTIYCATRFNPTSETFKKYVLLNPTYSRNMIINQCIKSVWIYTVLHDGFKFPKDQKIIESVLFIKGKEAHWTLGAIIYALLHDLSYSKSEESNHEKINTRNI